MAEYCHNISKQQVDKSAVYPRMHEDAHATRQMHCQWRSGQGHAKHRDTNKIPREYNHHFCAHMNVIKITIPKIADTLKDELLLGGGICHVTVRRCITRTVN